MFRQFGVPVLYCPADSVRRRTIVGIPRPEKEQALAEDDIEKENEQLWLDVTKDPDDAEFSGIDDPKYGDAVLLTQPGSAAWELESMRFSYQNQTRNDAGGVWSLLFARKRPRRFGGRR